MDSSSTEAHKLAAKLKGSGRLELAMVMEAMAQRLDDAMHSNLDAAVTKKSRDAGEALGWVLLEGALLLGRLQAEKGVSQEAAAAMSKVLSRCREVSSGRVLLDDGSTYLYEVTYFANELDECIDETRGQIRALREAGKDKVGGCRHETHTATTSRGYTNTRTRLYRHATRDLECMHCVQDADDLQTILDKIEEAREAGIEGEALRRKDEFVLAEMEASRREEIAADAASGVAAGLITVGMQQEADRINALRELLASGEITAEQLEKGSTDAHELAKELKAAGKTHLSAQVEGLAEKLDAAVHSSLGP